MALLWSQIFSILAAVVSAVLAFIRATIELDFSVRLALEITLTSARVALVALILGDYLEFRELEGLHEVIETWEEICAAVRDLEPIWRRMEQEEKIKMASAHKENSAPPRPTKRIHRIQRKRAERPSSVDIVCGKRSKKEISGRPIRLRGGQKRVKRADDADQIGTCKRGNSWGFQNPRKMPRIF